MNDYEINMLIDAAKEASDKAYVPYSEFPVGAAVMCEDGTIYSGCNIENASYSATICAERVAIFKAVSDGNYSIKAIAVYSENSMPIPCGTCLQVMAEFNKDMKVYVVSDDDLNAFDLVDLLPFQFSLDKESL